MSVMSLAMSLPLNRQDWKPAPSMPACYLIKHTWAGACPQWAARAVGTEAVQRTGEWWEQCTACQTLRRTRVVDEVPRRSYWAAPPLPPPDSGV